MGFKTGLIVGFGVGFVLGSRAGRERYEELRRMWDEFAGNPRVRQAVVTGRGMAGAGAKRGLQAVQGGVERGSASVRERLGKEEAEDAPGDVPEA